ncbi:cysteine proteinase [Macrolepiota fuliginosa MF-IS2]|uniref:ubiquitinyl hydrolase 1 n=1 Tax=Macrolepiota fuliginosa MF-IS2 TaxID=1400762 RepID=A0A9P5XDF0_9AGAR|nr:cysteine proteinase [Macrolepiota fuliginosa MF-IS2]
MHRPDNAPDWLIYILSSNLFQQIAPVVVLLFVPTLVLLAATSFHPAHLFRRFAMGLESIGLSLSWILTSSTKPGTPPSPNKSSNDKKAKKHIRSRNEQLAQNGSAQHAADTNGQDEGYYPGLVNISGTYCFMNSTLQALASLTYLQPHIDAINAKAEVLDVPTPVIDALKDLFRRLNKPHSNYHAIRPNDIIQALSSQTEGRSNSLFYSREHQDAQELFQVVSECIKNEITAVDKEAYRDRGLGGLANVPPETMRDIGKGVFDGLTANRRSCCVCGYTEAVMHFALDNWQLAVPRLAATCRLEDCLADYTRLELLKDCICRKCSIIATHKRLQQDVLKLEHEISQIERPSNSKKERLKKVRKMEGRVRQAIEEERIEDDLKDVRMEKVFSPASTKQAMIARPPPVLALHINRSVHYGHYASKNNVRLIFPEVLDLTPYSTSGNLSTVPTSAISTPPPALPRSTTPTPSTYANPRIIYRLAAVVCHYGQHSFGHYICYRRKPRHPNVGAEKRWAPPTIADPFLQEDDSSTKDTEGDGPDGLGPIYVFENEAASRPGKGWLRISDDAVRECGIETVLKEGMGAFMLYYERAVHEQPSVYLSGNGSPRSSEETLKPELRAVNLNGSAVSLVSEVGIGVKHPHPHSHPHAHPRAHSHADASSVNGITAESRQGRPQQAQAVGLAASLSQSQTLAVPGARIVRNVTTTRRSRSAASRSYSSVASTESTPMRELTNGHVTPAAFFAPFITFAPSRNAIPAIDFAFES